MKSVAVVLHSYLISAHSALFHGCNNGRVPALTYQRIFQQSTMLVAKNCLPNLR
jgi:hypothetical protein